MLEQAAQAVEALSVEMVKARLDGDLGSLSWWVESSPWKGLELDDL